ENSNQGLFLSSASLKILRGFHSSIWMKTMLCGTDLFGKLSRPTTGMKIEDKWWGHCLLLLISSYIYVYKLQIINIGPRHIRCTKAHFLSVWIKNSTALAVKILRLKAP